jgi:uncharacterized protein YbbK (DUF523 family)
VDRPRVGISRCLLGDEVRYDGGHKRDSGVIESLGPFVEWVSVCPEIEIGMGIPREPIHLVRASHEQPVRVLGVHSGVDWTNAMREWSRRRVAELGRLNLSGYVLKADSPSCGLRQVRVTDGSVVTRTGRGLFAQALVEGIPDLPVEEETQLQDARARARFLERVLEYDRVRRSTGAQKP